MFQEVVLKNHAASKEKGGAIPDPAPYHIHLDGYLP
jgi:hypothetical protein